MSFYTDASLVLIPSGIKDQKVYSAKPIDGSGDLTFSRASNATRVNSSGLVEKVRENLLTYSQDFSNADWVKVSSGTGVNPVVTANNATAPDGTLTADTIAFDAGAGTSGSDLSTVYQTLTLSGSIFAGSFYARVTSGTGELVFRHATGGGYTKANVTTTWQRFSSAEAFGGGTQYFEIGIRRGVSEPVNASLTVEMWGAQLETGDIATNYIATTSAAVSVGPVSGLPRLDYSGGASCPSLLLEPQRTNLVPNSGGLDPAQAFGATLTKNNIVSPDGYQNASLLTPSGGAGGITLMTSSFSGYYTISVYLKGSVNGQKVRAFADLESTIIDWTITTEWVRYTATFNATNPAGQSIYLLAGAYFTPSQDNPFYIYGAQIEAGSYATSYIPTLSTAVTRVADLAQKTSATAIIGQTEGSIYWEIDLTIKNATGSDAFLNLDAGSFGNTIYFYKIPDGRIACDIFVGAVTQASFILAASSVNVGTVKMALGYANNNSAFFVNGVQVGTTDTSCTIPAMNRIQLGNTGVGASFNRTKQVLLFPTRLSNDSLASLTTL